MSDKTRAIIHKAVTEYERAKTHGDCDATIAELRAQLAAAEERERALREAVNRHYPIIASRCSALRWSGEEKAATLWGHVCRDLIAAMGPDYQYWLDANAAPRQPTDADLAILAARTTVVEAARHCCHIVYPQLMEQQERDRILRARVRGLEIAVDALLKAESEAHQ